MQWTDTSDGEGKVFGNAPGQSVCSPDEGLIRFMIAIDNFQHVRSAYGEPASRAAMECVGTAVLEWLGRRARIESVLDGAVHGTVGALPRSRAGDDPRDPATGILANPPAIAMPFDDTLICLSLSGSWAVLDRGVENPGGRFGDGRASFFGASVGQGQAWADRYRSDMRVAAQALAALGGPGIVVPARAQAADGAAPKGRGQEGVRLIAAWRAIRDAVHGDDVLYYELCPELVSWDGRRRELGGDRQVLERVGLSFALDRHLVDHAIDLLQSNPDLALCVPVSPQSACACPRWSDVTKRLTGDYGVARRLAVAITESADFPDFAGAVQFVSRLRGLGCAVAIDNFGLGYAVEQFDSGAALLERARDGLSGCIVLDVRMPGVSGLEVQKRLASLDIHTPVIVVSGYADIAMAVQAMKANAFEFLTKPFRDQDLFDAIGAAMERDSSQAMQSRERRQADRLIRNLTAREHEVFLRLCNGQVGKQIAHELGMSEATVKVHRRSILHKLNVKHLGELILTYAPIVRMLSEEAN